MKVVILAGGLGTRLSEETDIKPKPMVEIGGKPILWHIMKIYSTYGMNDFIICCGYKGYLIKEFFNNYLIHQSDITFDLKNSSMKINQNLVEPWKVTLVDTGENTMTGGRIKRIKKYIKDEEQFCVTYGDGLCNVNISDLIKFHKSHGKLATLTATLPPGRYGALNIGSKDNVEKFQEKPDGDGSWINGGFFVLSPKVLDFISNDQTAWEEKPLSDLAQQNQLKAFKHNGFWQPMDTLRDKINLNQLWDRQEAPWKIWK
jgi:glucose-1-phosphate cytidylyltransferase